MIEGESSGASTAKLELRAVTHVFGSGRDPVKAIDDVTIADIPEHKFVSILGPSGCGKSTIFNIIAGLFLARVRRCLSRRVKITGMVGFVG